MPNISLSSLDVESLNNEIALHEFMINDDLERLCEYSRRIKNNKSVLRLLKRVLKDFGNVENV